MTLHMKRRLYVAAESTFATEPSADGSGYSWIPAVLELGELQSQLQQIRQDYISDAQIPSFAPIAGQDGWQFDFKVPLIGLSADAADEGSPPADDWLDILLTHLFGTQAAVQGQGVGAGSTTSDLVLDADSYSEGDMLAVFDTAASLTPNRVQWCYLDADDGDGTYTPAPDFSEAPADATSIAYGSNIYRVNPEYTGSLAFIYAQDTDEHQLLGGRCTAASINLDAAGGIWTLSLTFQGDRMTVANQGTYSAETNPGGSAALITNTPVKGTGSPIWFNNTSLSSVSSVTIDLGVQAGHVASTEGQEGRGAANLYTMDPTITVTPLYSSTSTNYQRNITQGELMIQMGKGQNGATAGTVDSLAFYVRNAVCTSVSQQDDNGKLRQSLEFKVATLIRHSSTALEYPIQLARA